MPCDGTGCGARYTSNIHDRKIRQVIFMGINMLDMKQSNAQTVLWSLYSCKTATIKDLAQLTGLSYATVGNILSALVESKEVLLGKSVSATGGRPSQAYAFNAEYAHVLALSVRVRSGEHIIRSCVGNLYGETIWQTEQCFERIGITCFEQMAESCLRAYPTIRVLAFSLPGVERNGVILVNDYTVLEGLSFTDHFQKKYGLAVLVENDVNAAVLGYGKTIAPISVLAGIYFPKYFNPGAGILIDGKILKGAGGYAGEVSLLPLGLDWLSMHYENAQQTGSAISRLISIVCSIVNPNHVILYGDFFTTAMKETIQQEIPTQAMRNIFPSIDYNGDLDADIISGLFALSVSTYQSGVRGKYEPVE